MYVLPESMREEVRKPFGRVVAKAELMQEYYKAARPFITVGDQCFSDALDAGFPPDIAVFDFKIKRVEIPLEMKKKFAPHASSAFVVRSAAGMISDELEIAITRVLGNGSGAILVLGEDDLSSLVIMANAQGGTLIYGQPETGAVVVPLGDGKLKDQARGVISRMTKR